MKGKQRRTFGETASYTRLRIECRAADSRRPGLTEISVRRDKLCCKFLKKKNVAAVQMLVYLHVALSVKNGEMFWGKGGH